MTGREAIDGPAGSDTRPSGGRWRLLLALAALCGALLLAHVLDAPARLREALFVIRELGRWGPVLFVGLYVVATVLFLPGWVLTLGAGAVFGLAKGAVTVSVAATLGATAAFLVGRYVAREAVASRLAAYPRFAAIDDAVGREGWKSCSPGCRRRSLSTC